MINYSLLIRCYEISYCELTEVHMEVTEALVVNAVDSKDEIRVTALDKSDTGAL